MNKYITALFVVLAATGVEAQTYQSALKAALENCSLEEISSCRAMWYRDRTSTNY